jgi:phosphomannomutase
MIKDKMSLSKEKLNASIAKLASRLNADRVSNLDGIRLDWSDRWLLLRGSNTEPIVRLIAESPSESDSLSLINQAKAIMAED